MKLGLAAAAALALLPATACTFARVHAWSTYTRYGDSPHDDSREVTVTVPHGGLDALEAEVEVRCEAGAVRWQVFGPDGAAVAQGACKNGSMQQTMQLAPEPGVWRLTWEATDFSGRVSIELIGRD